MRVENNILHPDTDGEDIRFEGTSNHSGAVLPVFLVMHYTAGTTLDGAVSWFKNPEAKASAHFVIDRDGGVIQLVELNRCAWHAGKSTWGNIQSLNRYSIGIELVNAGKLQRRADGKWVNWANTVIPDEQVSEAKHKNEAAPAGWHIYPEPQLNTAIRVAQCLNSLHNFQDVLGHDDIAPQRKTDPGPLFPLNSFRSAVLGRE